jgi:tetratricopeptide (TPR) repeat protein
MRIKALLGSSALLLLVASPVLADAPIATDPGRTPDAVPGGQALERKNTGGLLTLPQAGQAVATNLGPEAMKRHDACLLKAEQAPKDAYEDGLIWRAEGGGVLALHCVARAQLGLGQYDEAAERLSLVAEMREVPDKNMRAAFLAEAGHAFLLAHRTDEARQKFAAAVELTPQDPDLRLDRAQSSMLLSDWGAAISDADEALKIKPNNPEALRMRGEAKLALRDFDGASADAETALKSDPAYVPALLLRGRVKEARAGRAID